MNKLKGRILVDIEDLDTTNGNIAYNIKEYFLSDPLDSILNKKYVPKAGDRIFIYPNSDIPRFKMKSFCEKHKVSVAKSKDTANVFFMNPNTANSNEEFFDYQRNNVFMYREYFLDYIKRSTKVGDVRYINLIKDLTDNTDSVIILHDKYTFENTGLGKHKLAIIEPGDTDENDNELVPNCENILKDFGSKIYFIHTDEQKNNFAFLENKDYYHSDALIELLNDGKPIDQEMYEGLDKLFNSTNRDDAKVAMEAMANSDFKKSAAYLLMIFYHHQHTIYCCESKNHVNFKSFLKFFDLQAGRGIDIDDIINKLKNKQLLNSTNLKIVMSEAKKIVKEQVESATSYFEPVDIMPIKSIQEEVAKTDTLEQEQIQVQNVTPIMDL